MNIAFIVVCQFPYGSASSMRARNIYKLLEMAGHSVHVISDYDTVSETEDCKEYFYEAVSNKKMSFIKRQLASRRCMKALRKYCQNNSIDFVLTNARYERVSKLTAFCRKKKIKLIVENCEWYDNSGFKLRWLDPRFYQNEKMIRYDFRKADGFISISRFLDEHNKKLGKKSIRIPTILDVESTPYSVNTDNGKITVVYTGSPGKSKEFLFPVIKVLADNPKLREKMEFHIYGPSYNDVLKNIRNSTQTLKKAADSVVIHGRIPQNEVQRVLTKADYLLFLRPDRRSSHAGFPTKLGESFAVGTPVITNDTGDLSLYIKTGENGFLLNSYKEEELKAVFEELINLNEKQYCSIRKGARKTAEESFDYRKYEKVINEVIK